LSISVIDDHSIDNSIDLVKNNYPGVAIHILPNNTKKLNLLRNIALKLGKSEFVFITDNDLNFDKKLHIRIVEIYGT